MKAEPKKDPLHVNDESEPTIPSMSMAELDAATQFEIADIQTEIAAIDRRNERRAIQRIHKSQWKDWNLDRNSRGEPLGNLNNATAILEQDPRLKQLVWFDVFLQRLMTHTDEPREWIDVDDVHLTLYIQRHIGIPKMARETVAQAVLEIGYRHVRNCVRDWMDGLTWDGTARIEHFFEDHFGAAANLYTHAASRNFWLCLAARAYRPGCKLDNMIVLEGEQGVGKSRALQVIGGPWFTEQHESVTNKAFFEVLQGKLLVEIGEMDAFSRADITRVKQVVTNPVDRYRESYGRYAKDHPRQCVFVGTTNRDDWNKDETGARRFWPIRCTGDIDIDAIASNRSQLFAEAVFRIKAGARWWDMPWDETKHEQLERYQSDPWQPLVEEYLFFERIGNEVLPRSLPLDQITSTDLLIECLRFERSRISKNDEMRIAACLRILGYNRMRRRIEGKDGQMGRCWIAPIGNKNGNH